MRDPGKCWEIAIEPMAFLRLGRIVNMEHEGPCVRSSAELVHVSMLLLLTTCTFTRPFDFAFDSGFVSFSGTFIERCRDTPWM